MLISTAFLATGFILLAKGGDLLVEGASSLAKHFRVSELVIGLTIVSLGTSAPELLVNIIASLGGSSDIALGNVVGSNICNTLLILGTAGMIAPIAVGDGTVRKEIPFCLFISCVLVLLLNDAFFDGTASNHLSRGDGLVLLLLFGLFMYYIYTLAIMNPGEVAAQEIPAMGTGRSIIFILLGLAGLAGGGKLVVQGAVEIAASFGVSEALIGLTIVAVGTSLPELFASAVAARRGKSDIAIGNVIGSNIFNILFVLGASSVIRAISFPVYMNTDMVFMVLALLAVFAFMFLGKRNRLERWEAFGLTAAYFFYIGYLVAGRPS